MAPTDPRDEYLSRLRQWRNRPDPDLTLGFLKKQFKDQVERPYRQLSSFTGLWHALVPEAIAQHTRLESFDRGVLVVSVDCSARLYELDRLLRSGLQRQLVVQHKGPALRRVRLRVVSQKR